MIKNRNNIKNRNSSKTNKRYKKQNKDQKQKKQKIICKTYDFLLIFKNGIKINIII